MASLLMLSPAPVVETPRREVLLDVGFVEEMKLHCQFWPGRVCCVLRRGASAIAGGKRFGRRRLGFDLVVLDADEPLPEVLIHEAHLVYCSADDPRSLSLPQMTNGRLTRLVYTLDTPPGAKFSRAWGAPPRALSDRLRAALREWRQEGALRAALRGADALQLNGVAVARAYHHLNHDALCLLENRLRTPMLARATDQQARAARLLGRAPLSLVHLGPLEHEVGVMDLLQVAYLLKQHGIAFHLSLHGEGALEGRLRDGITALGLTDTVALAGNVGFDFHLVPYLRREADVMLAPFRAAHPASAYLEAMGCGVPVLGYANATWRRLQAQSTGGWACRSGSVAGMVRALVRLDNDRAAITRASGHALAFARRHTFERVFASRMMHLRRIAGLE